MNHDKKRTLFLKLLLTTASIAFIGCSDAKFQGSAEIAEVKTKEDNNLEVEKDKKPSPVKAPVGPVEPPPVDPPVDPIDPPVDPVDPPDDPVDPPADPVDPPDDPVDPPVEPVYLYKEFTQGKIEDVLTQIPALTLLPLDIVLVIDNSVSMTAEQNIVQEFLPLILSSIEDFDWQIGITTTDVKGKDGIKDTGDECLHELIKKGEANIMPRFSKGVNVGIDGAATERGLYMGAKSLLNNCTVKNFASNGPWIRPNSAIAVIIVSDEKNCHGGDSTNGRCPANDTAVNMDKIDNKLIANADGYLLLIEQLKSQRVSDSRQLIKTYGFLNPDQNEGYIDVINAGDWFALNSKAEVNSPEYLALKEQFAGFARKVGQSIKDQVTTTYEIDTRAIPESLEIFAEGVQKLSADQFIYNAANHDIAIKYDILVNGHVAQYYQIKYKIKIGEIISRVTLDVLPKQGSISIKAINKQGIEVDFEQSTFTVVEKDVVFDPAPEFEDVVTIRYEAQ
ncbi:MAG: hypothetical protein KBD78_01910 [Oligoflexales bacterium]|nr:hypothetical protein [Oligoflexales bacterium]